LENFPSNTERITGLYITDSIGLDKLLEPHFR